MSGMSRRSVLRAGAGAAVAVPASAIGLGAASTAADGPVLVSIHDATRGEVVVLHGLHEVVVQDRDLVAHVLRVARTATATTPS